MGFFARYLIPAVRNLVGHRRRSGFALAAITFGVVALIQASGFIDWIFRAMREDVIQSRLGHIQAVKPGYFERGAADPFAFLLPEASLRQGELEGVSGVEAVAGRLVFSGLIGHGETTVSFIGEGVDPAKEAVISRRLHIRAGQSLSSTDPEGIIIGAGLAEQVGVGPGNTVILLATTSSGGMNAVEATVRGVFFTSTKAYDDAALRVSITLARNLLRVSGDHIWVMRLEDTALTAEMLARLRARFPLKEYGVEFVPWYDRADFYNKTVVLFSRQVNVVQLIIALIIVLSISNTLIMSVLERTREIGTLMAVGLRRQTILSLFLSEGLVLGVVGGFAGLAAGVILAEGISAIGIPMPPPPGMAVGFTGEILVTWPLALKAVVIAVGATLLASLYPAWKASRLQVVDALRHNQ